ncbi:amidase [Colletotrichum graminicola M1.001]|uniref:Amidase n=1 Tax=Colletotrichum graminicola (strain M1.001 / M2 / FGSC 10212) TaxID=645133 RepID=E3QSW6_COLGM|nr:amidase [Colletotrichum graminicola M1.001]EFQ33954.1 amidase [Colletotrichum graminicola M1.001]
MSVFSLEVAKTNPVDGRVLDENLATLGVSVKEEEKDDYQRLLAVFHESVVELVSLPDYVPPVDEERFPREDIRFPEASDNPLGAWAWRCRVEDKTRNGGLLAGKKIAIKDNIAVKGVPMLLGTDFVKNYVPSTDATCVTRLLRAGAIIEGKSVCENMCHSATSSSSSTGHVHNPYAKGYSSGGSSSGSGALVSNGDVDMALGADQGGSIRVPAGSNEPTNDYVGPMTRTLLDNALMLQVISGNDNIDDRSFPAHTPDNVPKYYHNLIQLKSPKDLSGFKIGILAEAMNQPSVETRVKICVEAAIQGFRELGATVEEVSIPFHSKGAAIWTAISKTGGYLAKRNLAFGRRGHAMNDLTQKFQTLTQDQWDSAYVSSKNIYLNGVYAQAAFPGLLGKATNLSRKLRDDYDRALSHYDILVAPNLPYVANSHTRYDASPLEKVGKQIGLTANTAPFNQSGHPVLAMPIGMLPIEEGLLAGSGTKLPVSMQLIGKWWHEEDVYRVAYAWSLQYDWKKM